LYVPHIDYSSRSLPHSITEEEVQALLAAPTVSDPLGNRDRTMLEVLYATGLRDSELVSLRLCDLNLNQGSLRIIGKGNRERMVPIGEDAIDLLREFTQETRPQILNNRQTEYVFPSRRGGPMTRQAFWHATKRYSDLYLCGAQHAPGIPREASSAWIARQLSFGRNA
jgi:integrase/recombinase XerD